MNVFVAVERLVGAVVQRLALTASTKVQYARHYGLVGDESGVNVGRWTMVQFVFRSDYVHGREKPWGDHVVVLDALPDSSFVTGGAR
jgi:hypothetical protein